MAVTLQTVGLVFDIVGVSLITLPLVRKSASDLASERVMTMRSEQGIASVHQAAIREVWFSRLGYAFLIIGFTLLLVGLHV